MCGIVGKVVSLGTELGLTSDNKKQIMHSLSHRGPDMQGEYQDSNIWLGHLRLSILDLSEAAKQPMISHSGRYIICYNGEVYNYTALIQTLDLSNLATNSDTEVVLSAFEKLGVEAFKLFNGMFAFSLYDKVDKKLWIVRDHLGIKPLYYKLEHNVFLFASEIAGLLAINNQQFNCDVSSVHEWLYYGNTLGEKTLYQGISKLSPGNYLELNLNTFQYEIKAYWDIKKYDYIATNYAESINTQIMQVRSLLEQAVKRQLVSDVPIGVFLSGGIDSSAITAFATRHYGSKITSYSAGFDFDGGVNELDKAKKVAALYGTEHHELHISGLNIANTVEQMVKHHGMPFSDAANIPLYLLSSKINYKTKVILQGDGGDEVFGGYSRYTTLSFYRQFRFLAKIFTLLKGVLPHNVKYYRLQRYANALLAAHPAEVMAKLLTEEDCSANVESVFAPDFRKKVITYNPFTRYLENYNYFKNQDIVNQMLLIDSMIILPDIFLEKVDRATMAASVEVRVPFLDIDLVDFCMSLPGMQKVKRGHKKWLLKQALQGIVPDNILYGKKTGFGVPYGNWLRGPLKALFFEHMDYFQRQHPGILDLGCIQNLYLEHNRFKRDRSFLLWKILNFMIWANTHPIKF